jgi:hypothetical protein
VFDQPYGVGAASWDSVWSPKELKTLFRQLDASCGDNKYMMIVYCTDDLVGKTKVAMSDHGFSDIMVVNWYKSNQNLEGSKNLVFAFELILIGFRGSKEDVNWYLPANPLMRHNVIQGHSLGKYHCKSGGAPINPCQKPPYLMKHIISAFLDPGSVVVVVGSGAGGLHRCEYERVRFRKGQPVRRGDQHLEQLRDQGREAGHHVNLP